MGLRKSKDSPEEEGSQRTDKNNKERNSIFQDSKMGTQNTNVKKYLERASSKPAKKTNKKLEFFNYV